MTTFATRKIVHIDEERCNGCGECVPSCAEGAIRIVDGKARLVSDVLCDGLGACLGHCPMGAITVEERPAAAFDEAEVERRKRTAHARPEAPCPSGPPGGGCPGSAFRPLDVVAQPAAAPRPSVHREGSSSELRHWPVQLALVPPVGPMWQDADVLIAADCVPFALEDFHGRLLSGKSLAIACPKLDDVEPYVQKLARIFAGNPTRSITVARMEVPCCGGLVRVVEAALGLAGRDDLSVQQVVVGVDGRIGA